MEKVSFSDGGNVFADLSEIKKVCIDRAEKIVSYTLQEQSDGSREHYVVFTDKKELKMSINKDRRVQSLQYGPKGEVRICKEDDSIHII